MGDAVVAGTRTAGRALSPERAVAEALAVAAEAVGSPARIPLDDALSRYGLSPRELEVLRLVVVGRSNAEIAAALFISPRTATTHVSHILAKLDLASRAEAAAWAVRHGLA